MRLAAREGATGRPEEVLDTLGIAFEETRIERTQVYFSIIIGGLMALLASFFFGFVPMFMFAAFVNWLDRYEKEPKLLLGAAFLWGVMIAGGGAYILNTAFGIGIYALTGSEGAAEIGTTSIVAPIIEEGLKGLAVLVVFLMFRKEFDSVLDGVVYARNHCHGLRRN